MSSHILSTLTRPRNSNLASMASYLTISDVHPKLIHKVFFNLSNIQYIAILLWLQMHLAPLEGKEELSSYIQKISGIFTLSYFIENGFENWIYSSLLIFVWAYLGILVITCLYCSIKAFSKSQGNNEYIKTITHSIFQFHFMLMFFLANIVLMAPRSPKNQFLVNALNIETEGLLTIINLVLVVINWVIGEFLAFFCFSPFEGTNPLSTRTSSFQLLLFNFKAISSLILPFLDRNDQMMQTITISLVLVLSIWMLGYLLEVMPYYNHITTQISAVWCSIGVCLSLVNLVGLAYFTSKPKGDLATITYLDFILIPVFVKLALTKVNKDIKDYLQISVSHFSTEKKALKKLFTLGIIRQSLLSETKTLGSKLYETYFLGDLSEHAKSCKQDNCFCRKFFMGESFPESVIGTKLKESLEEYIHQRNIDFLRKQIDVIKKNNQLKIALVNLILNYRNDKITMALSNLFSISDKNYDFNVKIKKELLIQRIQKKLDTGFLDLHKGGLDIKSFINFYTLKVGFIDMLLSNTRKYIDFWAYYKQTDFNILKCLQKSIVMENEAEKIEASWESSSKSTKFFHQMRDIYCVYLALVRNTPSRASKIACQSGWNYEGQGVTTKFNNQITQENIVKPDILFISASMIKEKLGRIQYVSENIEARLGYKQQDLLGKSVSTLMPPIQATCHDSVLVKHLQKGMLPGGVNGYQSINGYIKAKRGHVQPCSLYLTIFPYIQNEINYISIIRLVPVEDEFLILAENGFIEGFSKKLGLILNLSSSRVTYVTDICLNISVTSQSSPIMFIQENFETFSEVVLQHKTGIRERYSKYLDSRFFSEKFDLSDVENCPGGQIFWRNLIFVKETDDPLESPYVQYDTYIKLQEIMGNKFFIMTLKYKNKKQFDRKTDKKSTSDKHHQDSILGTEGDLIPTEKLTYPHILPLPNMTTKDLKSSLSFTRIDLLIPTMVNASDSLPTRQRVTTDLSHFQLETDHNFLLKKQEIILKTMKTDGSHGIIPTALYEQDDDPRRNNPLLEDEHDEKRTEKASVSLASLRGWRSQLEENIYAVPKNLLSKYTSTTTKLIAFLCVCFLVTFLVDTHNNLFLIKANVRILTISSRRLFWILQTKRGIDAVYLLNTGLFEIDRVSSYGLPRMDALISGTVQSNNVELNKYNVQLRISLNQTEDSLHRKFYSNLIPLIANDSGRIEILYKNTFDTVTELISRADIIAASVSKAIMRKADEDREFLRRNVLNQLLITSEQLNYIIIEDTHIKCEGLIRLALGFMIFIIALNLVLTSVFIWQQLQIIKSRNLFIDLFLRINKFQITTLLNNVSKFETSLVQFHNRNYNFDFKVNNPFKGKEEVKVEFGQFDLRRKNANMQGINIKSARAIALTIVLFMLFLVPFLHLFAWITAKDKMLQKRFDTIVEVNTGMFEMVLMTVGLYEYLTSYGTANLRDRPVSEEWEAIYKRRAQAQRFFYEMLITNKDSEDECDSSTMKALEDIVNGNLCEILPKERFQAVCPLLGKGALTKGIQSVNSFYLFVMRNAKNEFDASNKTFSAAKAVFDHQEFKDLDLFLARWQYSAFQMIGNLFENCTVQIIERIEANLILYLILYVCSCVFGGGFISYIIIKFIEDDRVAWRKVSRKIPLDIVNSNKMMKNYLIN